MQKSLYTANICFLSEMDITVPLLRWAHIYELEKSRSDCKWFGWNNEIRYQRSKNCISETTKSLVRK